MPEPTHEVLANIAIHTESAKYELAKGNHKRVNELVGFIADLSMNLFCELEKK